MGHKSVTLRAVIPDSVRLGANPEHGRVAEDPDASRTHVHILRRYAESDCAYDLQGSRIDPQEGAVVAIADPDRTFPDCRPGWSPTDGDLADNRVRFRIDDSDGVACEYDGLARAIRRRESGRHKSGHDREYKHGAGREDPAGREPPLPDGLGPLLFSDPRRLRIRRLERAS